MAKPWFASWSSVGCGGSISGCSGSEKAKQAQEPDHLVFLTKPATACR